MQPGETLNSIAVDYGVDPAALASANNLTNATSCAGQVLVIPGITEREAMEARGTRHTVQTGESLSQIAQQYGVTVEQILAVNGLTTSTPSSWARNCYPTLIAHRLRKMVPDLRR